MVAANLTLFGAKALQKSLVRVGIEYNKPLGKALHREAEWIFDASQKIVPYERGPLRDSGMVTKVKYEAFGDPYVEVGYGTKYALPVHEMPDSTNWTTAGTGAKYLEKPFNERMRGWKKRVAFNTKRFAEASLRRRIGATGGRALTLM